MKKKTKRIAIVGALSLLSAVAASFPSITLANYIIGQKSSQSAYGLGGERETSIFFNANIWKQGKSSSGQIVDASYYLYAWKRVDAEDSNQTVLIPSAHINPTISGVLMDLYVFEYDTNLYNRMIFLRWDPSIEPSADLTYGSGHGLWNKTSDLSYSSSINYYCIDSWGTGSPAVATPTTNRIVKDSSLHWPT